MFVHYLFHVQVLIPSVICLKGLTASPIHPFLPTFRLYPPASSFLPSFLLSSPPSSHTIPLWRGIVIIHSDMFWCCFFFFFCFLLSVGTHPHTLFHSISLNPSLRLFRLSLEREKASKRERERALLYGLVFLWQPLCESAVCLSLFVHCVASKDVMIMCLCALLVCTFICSTVHLFCQMKSKYCISMYLWM